MKKSAFLAVSWIVLAMVGSADAEEAPARDDGPIIAAIANGKPILDVRYRFETKDQDGFAANATAHTVRTRLGYETDEIYHLKFLVEFENVLSLGDGNYNSTTNGKPQFPVIADPKATEINRAQVTFTRIDKTPITIGRQVFNLNNQRLVGAVDFRQNQQTFDAARISSTIIDRLSIDYIYIDRVHRVFGDDNPLGEFNSDSHVISAAYDAGAIGVIKGYGVLLDLKEAPALSSSTWGVRYENTVTLDKDAGIKIGLTAEYASQRDYAGNPFDYSESYLHGELSLKVESFTGVLGYEQLGGDGVIGFSTPLATLHKFQGFADVFLNTPGSGIEDFYGTFSYAFPEGPFGAGLTVYATYHDFSSESGGGGFGEEYDTGMNIKIRKHWSAEIKGALFNGAGAFADRNIIWASLRFQY